MKNEANDNSVVLDVETRARLARSRWEELNKKQKHKFKSPLVEHLCYGIFLLGYDYAWEDFLMAEHEINPGKDYKDTASVRELRSLIHWEFVKTRIHFEFGDEKAEEEIRALFLYGYDKAWEDFTEISRGLVALDELMNNQN